MSRFSCYELYSVDSKLLYEFARGHSLGDNLDNVGSTQFLSFVLYSLYFPTYII